MCVRIEIEPHAPSFIGGGNLSAVEQYLVDAVGDGHGALDLIEVRLLLRSLPLAPRQHAVDDVSPAEFDALLAAVAPEGAGWGSPQWCDAHEARRARGGSLMFRRSAATVFVTVLSEVSEHDVYASDTPMCDVFAAVVREVVTALEPLRRRVKPGDPLDAARLLDSLIRACEQVPTDAEELAEVLPALLDRWERAWDAAQDPVPAPGPV